MLRRIVNIVSRMPLCMHYFFADYLLYPIMYHVIRYRRKVVAKNMHASFPHASSDVIEQYIRQFYHHFADTIVRIIFGYTASDEIMREHMRFTNVELIDNALLQYGGVIVMMGHMGTWEWLLDIAKWTNVKDARIVGVYRQLKNRQMDELMQDIRAQRSPDLVEKRQLLRYMVKNRAEHHPQAIGMLADQKPSPNNAHYWTTFLNQETSFLDGSEVLARKFNYPVVYFYIRSPHRGYYEVDIQMISEHPQDERPFAITEKYARILEQNILQQPQLWLWTHNRWKFKRPIDNQI